MGTKMVFNTGGIALKEGYIQVPGGQIYYKKTGEGQLPPLVLLHGGPGGSHNGFKPLEALGKDRPVIFYDQLGSGKSDRPEDGRLWQLERFIDELSILRSELGLDKMHLLGHSWGTMLAASYMLNEPNGIESVTFSSPCLSAPQWAADQKENLKTLPEDIQKVIRNCEAEGTTDSKAYKEAVKVFNLHFVCRLKEIPAQWKAPKTAFNDSLYQTMWGTSEFNPTGLLKNYDVTEELSKLKLPVLFTCGQFDEATPQTTKSYADRVQGARFHVFPNSAHMPYVEEPESYIQVIGDFLRQVDDSQK